MSKINEQIILYIEKMVYEGYGLSKIKVDDKNFVFFVSGACTGDKVLATITKVNKSYGFATTDRILEKSEHRVEPFCPLHKPCGGCQWQFIDYNYQLKIKNEIVKDILTKALGEDIEVLPTIASPEVKEFRHKIQMPVSQTKNSKRFLIGYYKQNSHDIVNIKYCPIQPKIINHIVDKIRNEALNCGINAYNEINNNGELKHVIFRISNYTKEILVIFVVNSNKVSKKITNLANIIFNEFDKIKGVSINFNTEKNNVILGEKTLTILGNNTYKENIDGIEYIISPESFFQVNPESFRNILRVVKEEISKRINNPTILDAYSGVGSFGLYLADISKSVTCVEEIKSACNNTITASKNNNINNLEVINGDAKEIFQRLIDKKKKFDVTILDPPRKGCSQEALDICNALTKNIIIYISCNPNSLARDLKYLKKYGYKVTFAQTADMFCHTYHVETIAFIEKS